MDLSNLQPETPDLFPENYKVIHINRIIHLGSLSVGRQPIRQFTSLLRTQLLAQTAQVSAATPGITTSVMNAVSMLREFYIGFLAVIDDPRTQKLIGVVTDRNLCFAALGELHDPTLNTVEDCMATDL